VAAPSKNTKHVNNEAIICVCALRVFFPAQMDAYYGTWVCDKSISDPLSPFLEALGVGWISRKAMDAGGVTWVVEPSAGGYRQTTTNVGGTKANVYVLGEATSVDGADGNAYAVTSTLGADGALNVAAVGVRARAPAGLG